ncbi:MAG: hypothetical protein HYZ45_02580 [Burkholderiales bacterium]|nr:hypothetical protein [Burkholderiales bacterium]
MSPYEYETPPAGEAKPEKQKRPWPVYVIVGLVGFATLGLVLFASLNWHFFIAPFNKGEIGPITFLGQLIYPLLLLISAIYLFKMRRRALYLFTLYLVWGVWNYLSSRYWLLIVDPAFAFCVVAYCLYLRKKGQLR